MFRFAPGFVSIVQQPPQGLSDMASPTADIEHHDILARMQFRFIDNSPASDGVKQLSEIRNLQSPFSWHALDGHKSARKCPCNLFQTAMRGRPLVAVT